MKWCTFARVNVKRSYPDIHKVYSNEYLRKYKSEDKSRILLAVTLKDKTYKHLQFIINSVDKKLLHVVIIETHSDEERLQRFYSEGNMFFHSEFSPSQKSYKLVMLGNSYCQNIANPVRKRHISLIYWKCRLIKLID